MESGSRTPAQGLGLWRPHTIPSPRLVEWHGRETAAIASADYVVVVGSLYDALPVAERLTALGIKAEVYPLKCFEQPTLYSLLGLIGVIVKAENPVIVDLGPGALVAAAVELAAQPYSWGRVLDRYAGRLVSPLHFRSLYTLHLLQALGVNLVSEAERWVSQAFTGGDAVASDRVYHVADLVAQRLVGEECLLDIYMSPYTPPSRQRCRLAWEVAAALDPRGEGAASVIAVERRKVYIGCKLLAVGDQCLVESEAVAEPIAKLLGAEQVRVEPVDPEEAACMAYTGLGYSCT